LLRVRVRARARVRVRARVTVRVTVRVRVRATLRSATPELYALYSLASSFCASDFFLRLVEREPSTAEVYSGRQVVESSARSHTTIKPSQSLSASACSAESPRLS
jgi:hypothetical protein